jgi:hypothetical protein
LREPWVYGISRCAYGEGGLELGESFTNSLIAQRGCGAVAYLCILAAPFAVDTVLLPVTLPHDLLFVE